MHRNASSITSVAGIAHWLTGSFIKGHTHTVRNMEHIHVVCRLYSIAQNRTLAGSIAYFKNLALQVLSSSQFD